MSNTARNLDETLLIIALNVLSGRVNPDQWQGLRRLDEDEEAVLKVFHEVQEWGFGKVEINVVDHRLHSAHPTPTYLRKDLIKSLPNHLTNP